MSDIIIIIFILSPEMVTYFNEIHYYLSLLASMSSIKGNNHERIAMASGSNRTVGIKAEVLNDLAR